MKALAREVAGKNPPRALRARGGGAAILLPSGEDARFYIGAFLAEFGVALDGRGKFVDAQGVELVISDAVFRDKKGGFKVKKLGRERYALLLADTVKRPDDIYETWVSGQKAWSLRRNYVARWVDANGRKFDTLVVFSGRGERRGVTGFAPEHDEYVSRRAKRLGEQVKRVYHDEN